MNRSVPASRSAPAASVSIAVFVGGAIGTLARAALTTLDDGGGWPWTTFLANVVGTTLLVVLLLRAHRLMDPAKPWRAALGPGLCGGLTTFSLFQVEIVGFMRDGEVWTALSYMGASTVIPLMLVLWHWGARR